MALLGGSMVVGSTATVLTGAVSGEIKVRSIVFNCPAGNSSQVSIGGSNVVAAGNPAYVTIPPGGSWMPPLPIDGRPITINMAALYARATAGTEILQVSYIPGGD